VIFKNPNRIKRLRSAGFVIALAVLFFSAASSHAQTAGILDNIAQSYKNAATGWTGTLLGYANRLFMLLATIELAWSFAVWALEKNEYQSLIAAVAKKIMWVGIFYALLLNGTTWIPAIIDSFVDAGSAASGSVGLSPSEVFTTGLDNAATMLDGIKKLSLLDDFASIVIAGLSAILIVLAFAVIAGQLLVALVESYIAISAGLLFLGFGGSRWTTDFVQKFIGYAVATGVKLFMLLLIIGIGNAQAVGWKAMLATIGTPGAAVFNIILTVLGGSILLAFLAIQIPAMAASMLSGSPALTGGAAASTAGMIGAGIVGAGAVGAATTLSAAKSVGGLASAVKAAYGEAGAQGATGLGRAVATLGNMGTAAARDTGNRMSEAIAPTKGGRMADISKARAAEVGAANTPATPAAPAAPTGAAGGSAASRSAATAATASTGSPAASSGASEGRAASTPAPKAPAAPGGQSVASATAADAVGAAGDAVTGMAGGSGPAAPAPGGVQEKAQAQKTAPGLEDRFRDLQQVRPPQLPSDAAPPATVHIKFDANHD